MTETSDKILDAAEDMIMRGGYNAFSFQDIAERVGIKKASIYYYFPAKADLGRDVIARYRARFWQGMQNIANDDAIGSWDALKLYVSPIVKIAAEDGNSCLCGCLSGEYTSLPGSMQTEVAAFFNEHQTWLSEFLKRGRTAGDFHFNGPAFQRAQMIFSAIEGAILIKRAIKDPAQLGEVLAAIQQMLRGN